MSDTNTSTNPAIVDLTGNLPVIEGVEFRTLERFLWYAFGSDGEIWTKRKANGPKGGVRAATHWRKVKLSICKKTGYRYISIQATGDYQRPATHVHRLIAEAFYGPCPDGMVCCHYDDNRANNSAANLRWDTQAGNHADASRNGRVSRGEQRSHTKLTEAIVRDIRSRYALGGVTHQKLADEYGVSGGAIFHILARNTWKHIE